MRMLLFAGWLVFLVVVECVSARTLRVSEMSITTDAWVIAFLVVIGNVALTVAGWDLAGQIAKRWGEGP